MDSPQLGPCWFIRPRRSHPHLQGHRPRIRIFCFPSPLLLIFAFICLRSFIAPLVLVLIDTPCSGFDSAEPFSFDLQFLYGNCIFCFLHWHSWDCFFVVVVPYFKRPDLKISFPNYSCLFTIGLWMLLFYQLIFLVERCNLCLHLATQAYIFIASVCLLIKKMIGNTIIIKWR